MNKKTQKVLMGWLPQESKAALKSFRFRSYSAATYKWTATALVIGTFAGALLGAIGVFLGLTEGLGAFLWPVMIGLIVGLSIGLVAVHENRKYKYKYSGGMEA